MLNWRNQSKFDHRLPFHMAVTGTHIMVPFPTTVHPTSRGRLGHGKLALLCVAAFAFSVALATNIFAQNALNCEPRNNVLDQVIRANLGKLHMNNADPTAIAAIDSVLSGLMAKEPRRDSIKGPFELGSDAQSLGMICMGTDYAKYKCTYIYSTRVSAGLGGGTGHADAWMFQFEVVVGRDRTTMRVLRIERLGGATAPTRC